MIKNFNYRQIIKFCSFQSALHLGNINSSKHQWFNTLNVLETLNYRDVAINLSRVSNNSLGKTGDTAERFKKFCKIIPWFYFDIIISSLSRHLWQKNLNRKITTKAGNIYQIRWTADFSTLLKYIMIIPTYNTYHKNVHVEMWTQVVAYYLIVAVDSDGPKW